MTVAELLAMGEEGSEAAQEGLLSLRLGYTETKGSPQLRKLLAECLSESVTAEEGRGASQLTAGHLLLNAGQEGIFLFFSALFRPGDHIIVQYPCYMSHYAVAEEAGCSITKWVAQEEHGWSLDVDFLERNIKPETKAIVLSSPHNPTGYHISHEALHHIIDVARKHDLWVFSDEAYRMLEHDEADRLPCVAHIYEKGVSLGALSKGFGLPGLRIGWLACRDEKALDAMAALKDYTTICSSAPSEYLATIALKQRRAILQRNLSIVRSNLQLLDAFITKHSSLFSWHKPKAGSVAFVRLLKAGDEGEGAKAFCERVVKGCGVLLLPSTCFDFGDDHFRVGYGRKNMPEALAVLDAFLTQE
ncbi:Capreomycidine synthase [Balamuthia mandrillaris]